MNESIKKTLVYKSLSYASKKLYEFLKYKMVGNTFTYTELSVIAGVNLNDPSNRSSLLTARKKLEKEDHIFTDPIYEIEVSNGFNRRISKGIKIVDHMDGIRIVENAIHRSIRAYGKSVKRAYNLNYNSLSADKQHVVNAKLIQYTGVSHIWSKEPDIITASKSFMTTRQNFLPSEDSLVRIGSIAGV